MKANDNKVLRPTPSMYNRLDGVRMTEQDRNMAKAYLRKTDALLDLIWLAGANIRAAIVGNPGARLHARKPIAVHLP